MKRNNTFSPCLLLWILLISLTACDKYSNGPEIQWVTGSSISYTYNSGVLTGFTANIKFEVVDGTSGEIKMTAEYLGEGKSCTGYVEPGTVYKAVVTCGISYTQLSGAVIVDCPTVESPYKIITDVKTGVAGISIK